LYGWNSGFVITAHPEKTGKVRPTFGGHRRPFAVARSLTGSLSETDNK
jgi:hypothetical protein